jgi:hypothetical protein
MGTAPTNLVDIDSAINSVLENVVVGTAVGVVAKATDADGNKITYSLSSNPGNLFAINADTGVVTTAAAMNYEAGASKSITVKAVDSTGLSTTQVFTIGIVNVNEAPTMIVDTNPATTVSQTAAINSVVGITAKATDPDAGDKITYSLTDDAGGLFKISATSGVVTVAKALDGLEHDIIVKATDAGGLSTTQTFHVGVNNSNATPINLTDTNTSASSVKQDAAVGTTVGITANAIDTNAGDSIKYSLSDNDGGRFAINSSTGVVTVAGPLTSSGVHNITVQATDAGGLHTDKTFAIDVGSTIHVSTLAELNSALKMATGGETILLKAGVNFGSLNMPYGVKPDHTYTSTVTIKSEDVHNQAIFDQIGLNGVQNLTIDSIKIETPLTQAYGAAFTVGNSSNITLKNSDLDGNMPMGVVARAQISGTDIRGSDHITLDGNTFHNFLTGTGIGNSSPSSYITVINNLYHDNLNDNSDYGSNLSHVLIENNTLYSPDASHSQALHTDFIQFWVEKDAIQNTSDVVIRGNFIYDNLGSSAQAIFMRGDYLQPDANGILANRYGLENITIENNVINSQHSNAISVSNAEGLVITNNILHYAGSIVNPSDVYVPGIGYKGSTDVTVTDNILPYKYGTPRTDTDIWQGNVVYNIGDGSANNYLMNPNAENATKEDFASLKVPAMLNADGTYKGAFVAAADANNPTAIFTQHSEVVNEHYQHTFDASLSLPQEGFNLNGATYTWKFSDGTTEHGVTVNKTFKTLGEQEVKLTVTDSKGHSSTTTSTLNIQDEVGVKMNFDGRFIDLSGHESLIVGMSSPVFVDTPYGGKALSLGANNDHIYIDVKNDPDLSGMQELTMAYSMQAAKVDNGGMILAGSHGLWSVALAAATNTVNVGIVGQTVRFVPTTNLADNQWHDIAITVSHNSFTFYVDGKSAYTMSFTKAQGDAIFNPNNTYGIHVGSSGPWTVDPTIKGTFEGNIDNLYIGSTALGAQNIAAMHTQNTTVSTGPVFVNHAPSEIIDIDVTANVIAENAQVGAFTNITARATDVDAGDRITYSLINNEEGNFRIDANTGVIKVGRDLDFETASSHNITVKATDLGGLSSTKTFTLNLTDINDGAGLLKDADQAINAVSINAALGTRVGVTAFAPESSAGKTTYSLSNTENNKYFSIDADTGVITLIKTPEALGNMQVLVKAVDSTGLGTAFFFNVNVTAEDTKPNTTPLNLIDGSTALNSVSEKAAIGSLVGITASATDPDGDKLTYSLADSASGKFAIDATTGVVSVAGTFDSKLATSHNITIKATDTAGLSVQKVFNIDVTNGQPTADTSAPTNLVDINAATNSVAENAAVGTTVGVTAQATDASTLTYSLTDNAGGKFAINTSTGVVTVAGALDYETAASHNIIVKATDAGGLSTTQTFAIGVTNVNEAPVNLVDSNSAANSVAENAAVGTAVGVTAKATDPDAGNTLTYSLTDNAGGRFVINTTTGVVTVSAGLDYETASSHNIIVKATDAGGLSTTQTFAIGVTNVNEAPINLVDSNTATNSVAENAAVGTVVGVTAKATDPDAGSTLTYSLADNAGGKFAINATTGVVTVAGAIDYEASQNQSIIVKESDAGGLSTTQTFTIGVTNVNEAPTNLVDSNTAANSVAQSAAIGTVVGITAKATDPDAGTLTYSLTDNAVGKFAIDATTGVVKVAGALDNTPSHKITVEAKDAGGLVTTQTFTIGVTDIHQTPTNPNAPTNLVDGNAVVNSVKEDATIGATVGITASATAPGALTYSLTDNADGKFAINASTGVVSVAGVLDYETASSHNITVKATDAANQSTSQMFTIGLTNVNEAPTDVVDGDVVVNAIDKKAEIGTSVGIAAQAIDPDADDTFTYSLTTNPNNLFAIDAKTGEVTLAGPLDDVTSYTITVTATDAEGLTIVHDFVIVVTEDVEDESIELIGTIGNDTLLGARNSDVLSGNMGADVLTGDAGNDALQGNQGADEVYGGEGEDTVLGGKGTDRMNGNTGDDTLNGNLANDIVHGGQGNDLVYGGQGDDTVFGDLGNDTVSGDMGRDYLMGGEGNDVFVFFNGSSTIDASDAIGDFKAGEDKIDLKAFGYTNVVVVSASSSTVVHDAYTLVLQARTTEDGGMFLSNSDLNLGIKLQGTEEINTTDFLL